VLLVVFQVNEVPGEGGLTREDPSQILVSLLVPSSHDIHILGVKPKPFR
jgi:hypothetical protein